MLSWGFKLASFGAFGYGAFVIVKWYVEWIAHYFIGDFKVSLIAGLMTFFLAPLAAVVDLVWHSLPKGTIDAAILFAACLIGARFLFFIGEKLGPRH